jgi:hypothetical protein
MRRLGCCLLFISVLCLILFRPLLFAQEQSIRPENAGRCIGQMKTVCGKVASTHFSAKTKEQPTLLNLDKPYPNQVFTVMIWGSDKGKFKEPSETLYSGKEICVTGPIKNFREKPEIIVNDPSQIRLKP